MSGGSEVGQAWAGPGASLSRTGSARLWRHGGGRGSVGRGLGGDAGSVPLELVLLVPVLVLLTLFVLWAGRGGRAGLTADLAAEEAATAAALCCEEGQAFESDRDALVAEIFWRPGRACSSCA